MNITLEIRPEAEAELRRRAHVSGCRFETFAASLLEDAAHLPSSEAKVVTGQTLLDASAKVRGLFTDDEIDGMFRRNRWPGRPVDFE